MSVRLALVGAADVPLLGAIMERAFDPRFGEAWSTAQLSGALGVADTWAQVGSADRVAQVGSADGAPRIGRNGDVFGFSLTRRIIDEAELMLVAVVPEERGGGLGRRLVEGAMEAARLRGARKMFLEVRDGNAAASRLYENLGFTIAGRRQNYYNGRAGERFDAITMRRDLP